MNTTALIIIVIASLGSNTSGKPVRLTESERGAVVTAVEGKSCSADNGACVAAVIAAGKAAYGKAKKAEKATRE